MTKSSILIDGSNFYFKLKDLKISDQLAFDFSKFTNFLLKGDESFEPTYYIGSVKTDGTKKMNALHSNQQKLLKHLKAHGYKYKLGYLLKSGAKFNEKGVDVNMAADILIQSYEKRVNKIFLVSSDTDLMPAIKQAKKLGIEVIYVGFEHMPSKALITCASKTLLLNKEQLKGVISK